MMRKTNILKRAMAIGCAAAVMVTYAPAVTFADVEAAVENESVAAESAAPAEKEEAPATEETKEEAPAANEEAQNDEAPAVQNEENENDETPAAQAEEAAPAAENSEEEAPAVAPVLLTMMTSAPAVVERMVALTSIVRDAAPVENEIKELTVEYNKGHKYDEAVIAELGKKAKLVYASTDGYELDKNGKPIRAGEYTVSVGDEVVMNLTITEIHSLEGLAKCTFSQTADAENGITNRITKANTWSVVEGKEIKGVNVPAELKKTEEGQTIIAGMASGAYINTSVVDYYVAKVFPTLGNEKIGKGTKKGVCTDEEIIAAMLNTEKMEEDNFDAVVLAALQAQGCIAEDADIENMYFAWTEITEKEIHFNGEIRVAEVEEDPIDEIEEDPIDETPATGDDDDATADNNEEEDNNDETPAAGNDDDATVDNNDDENNEDETPAAPARKHRSNASNNEQEIPENDVPLADIPNEEVPLSDLPSDMMNEEEIPEDEVPLAELPQTGGIGAGIFLLAGGAIAAAGAGLRRKEDEE